MAAVPSTSELSSLELRHRRNYVKFLHQHRYDHNHAPSACLNAYLSVYTHTNSSANLRGVFQALVRGALLLGDQAFLTPSTNLVVTRHINYLQRLYPHQIRRAPPMLWSDLKLILEELQPLQCIKNLSTALLLRACFENGLRCGDALRLKTQDVLLELDGRIRISLPYTKTCRTPVQFVYHHTGEPYCFVALLYHFRKKCPYIWKPELYLFCALRRGKPSSRATPIPHYDGTRPLSVFRVAALLRRFSVRLGLSDILRVHSMRVGFACACMQAGIPLSEIQKLGQWKTDTYLLYVRDSVFRNHIRDGLVQSMVDFHMESV